jgi:hypothetical protein
MGRHQLDIINIRTKVESLFDGPKGQMHMVGNSLSVSVVIMKVLRAIGEGSCSGK